MRQLYSNYCCSDQTSETFAVPSGYSRFQASIGLETGASYPAINAPVIVFEVDLGSASNTAYNRTMNYGDAAAPVDLDVSGQTVIVLQTSSHTGNCFICRADAVWGDARLVP